MKKTKQPGDNISLKTKKTEDPIVMNWINAQTNLMDSLRYLIEHEIVQNGVRNLQTVIPAERNVLGTAVPVVESVVNAPASPTLPNLAVVQSGIQEVSVGLEEVTEGQAVQSKEPVQLSLPASLPATAPAKTERNQADDEIADEDIEAWV